MALRASATIEPNVGDGGMSMMTPEEAFARDPKQDDVAEETLDDAWFAPSRGDARRDERPRRSSAPPIGDLLVDAWLR